MEMLRPGTREALTAAYGEDLRPLLEQAAQYMETCPVVLVGRGGGPGRPSVAFLSDGRWVWTSGAVSAVREGKVVVPLEFARAVTAQDPPASLSETAIHEALALIRS